MRKIISSSIFFILIHISFLGYAQKDMPNPPSNIIPIRAGSYVIPMDTNYQNIVPAGQAPFNLKAYGLINQFLQNHIPVKWAIRSGKNMNDSDFSSMAQRVFPDTSLPSLMDFRAGPFIVVDTSICDLSTVGIIKKFGNNVAVYRLLQNINADVRYTLVHRPQIALLTNGASQLIHSAVLDSAGISNYDFIDAANIGNAGSCYTFASEANWNIDSANQNAVDKIKNFVLGGGNFFAQSQATESYEYYGNFMSTAGISMTSQNVSHDYHNADLAAMQIHGTVFENKDSSSGNWTLDTNSSWKGTTYKLISSRGTDTVISMGMHLTAPLDTGGNAFFLGCRDYMKNDSGIVDFSDMQRMNALRIYLNTVFIPSINYNVWAPAGLGYGETCAGSISLGCSLPGPPGASYMWSPSFGLSCVTCATPVASPAVTTNYVLTVTGNNGCIASNSFLINVNTTPPVSLFTSEQDCLNMASYFSNYSQGNISEWHWRFGDGDSSAQKNPSHFYDKPGNYNVTLVIKNNFGCMDSFTKIIQLDPDYSFFIPNCFTPNGDFSNMTFYGKGRGIMEYTIAIYNRWGIKIWTCHADEGNALLEKPGEDGLPSACKWDGTYMGHTVEEDVYVWKVELKNLLGKDHSYVGHVSVVK